MNVHNPFPDYQKIITEYGLKLREGNLKSNEAFDKMLTLISSGGLALSMAFIEKLGGVNPTALWCLISCWIFLGLTLLSSLASSLVSIQAHRSAEKFNDEILTEIESSDEVVKITLSNTGLENIFKIQTFIKKQASAIAVMQEKQIKNIDRLNNTNDIITYITSGLLLIGVSLLIIFASLNTLKQNQNGQRTTAQQPIGTQTERTETRH